MCAVFFWGEEKDGRDLLLGIKQEPVGSRGSVERCRCQFRGNMSIIVDRKSIDYCPYYCEENIWHLARRPELAGYDARVVFISNARRLVHFEAQRICDGKNFLRWDYHVILLVQDEKRWRVFDPDSLLPFGCRLAEYLLASFPFGATIPEAPLFRVIRAAEYIHSLSSDRRHMRNEDGSFMEPPPNWPVIRMDPATPSNLWDFVDMGAGGRGEVLDLRQLRQRFLAR